MCTYIYIYIYIYFIYTYIHTYIHTCIHIHTYTYTHSEDGEALGGRELRLRHGRLGLVLCYTAVLEYDMLYTTYYNIT